MKQPKILPSKWVSFFSWCFAFLSLIPFFVGCQLILHGDVFGFSAYGFSIGQGSGQVHFTLMLAGAIMLGGLTAIFILTSCKFAYEFGIVYCLYTLGIIGYGQYFSKFSLEDKGIQSLLVLCFLCHLIKNRSYWRTSLANKTAHSNPLPAPSRSLNENYEP